MSDIVTSTAWPLSEDAGKGITWAPTPLLVEVPLGLSIEYMKAKLSPSSPRSICREGCYVRSLRLFLIVQHGTYHMYSMVVLLSLTGNCFGHAVSLSLIILMHGTFGGKCSRKRS